MLLKEDAFEGWSGGPITDPAVASKYLLSFDPKAAQLWLFSDNQNLINSLTGKK